MTKRKDFKKAAEGIQLEGRKTSAEARFEDIKQRFIAELDAVDCPREVYVEAVEEIIGELEIAKDAAREGINDA
jgi:hypothetical protein